MTMGLPAKLLVLSMCLGAVASRALAAEKREPNCIGCAMIPFAVTRISPPADVELPGLQVVANGPGGVTALRHWIAGGLSQSSLVEIKGQVTSRLSYLPPLSRGGAAQTVIYFSGSGKSRVLLTQDSNTGSIYRSSDSGASWTELKFSVDGKSASEWSRAFDRTPGDELVPRLAAVSPRDPLEIYTSFKLWIPRIGKPTEFATWRDIPGMYVSHDGGQSWHLFSSNLVAWSPLGVGGQDPNFIVAVDKNGLVESHDGGRSWKSVGDQAFFNQTAAIEGRRQGLSELKVRGVRPPNEEEGPKIQIYQVELSPTNPARVYVRTNIGLVTSADGGRTWCVAREGNHVFDEINGLVISKDGVHDVLLISTTATKASPSRILGSMDGGCTFRVVYTMGPIGSSSGRHSPKK